MKKIPTILLVLCLTGFLLWFTGVTDAKFAGFSLAMSAVFFILTFITHVIGQAEAEETPHEATDTAKTTATSQAPAPTIWHARA